MTTNVQDLLEEARQLSPREQLDLIRGLSESLQEQFLGNDTQLDATMPDAIPPSVQRTPPATNLDDYVADFWPEGESVDEFIDFVRQQRDADRLSDQ